MSDFNNDYENNNIENNPESYANSNNTQNYNSSQNMNYSNNTQSYDSSQNTSYSNDAQNYNSSQFENSYRYSAVPESPTAKPKKKGKGFLKAIAFVLCMAIVGSGSILVYRQFDKDNPSVPVIEKNNDNKDDDDNENVKLSETDSKDNKKSDSEKKSSKNLIELAAREDAKPITDIVDEAMPSVVGIASTFEYTQTASSYGDIFDSFGFGFGGFGGFGGGYDDYNQPQTQTKEVKGTGTGIVMTADGYIITNAHVIYDDSEYNCGKAVDVSVVFADESEKEAKIIGYDTESDIAVLKVDAKDLTPATFGESDDLKVGELVIAIGNPLGFELFGSVTTGIVSALNREITINEKQMTLIQTDAAINSGNSGGPLINSCGQVIGINSAKMSSGYSSNSASVEGLGFAIPITHAKSIIDDLINYGYVTGKPQLGISGQDIDEINARYYNFPRGVFVSEVEKGGAADKAGIKPYDIIIGIEDEPVTSINEMNEIKNKYKAGDTIKITINRSGEDMDIKLTLEEIKPKDN